MKQYDVTGMSCAACSAKVEKAVCKVSGVESVSVSLLTNSMGVVGNASEADVIMAVKEAGYGAFVKGQNKNVNNTEDTLEDKESPVLKKRLLYSIGFLIVLMYFSMGHSMWNWVVPDFFDNNPMAIGLLQMILTIAVMIINQKFFVNGFKGLVKKSPNMDTLVALGSSAAFVYSTYALFAMSGALVTGNVTMAHGYLHELYFESSAMILTLITVGKMLEARSKGKTTDALKALIKMEAKTAVVIVNGEETEVAIEEVKIGDVFVVRPGENIPVDGIVTEGSSAVDESALTGESIPVDKTVDDKVSAGTINNSGYLKCSATRVGEDTTLSQIIKMVSDAAATKAPIAKVADKVSGVFVPVVIVIAIITVAVWLITGADIGYALARGISVLVISCPCALGLATPVAIMVGNGVGAKNGIMFKTAVSLEQTGKAQVVVLDKTGTITNGTPKVTDILPVKDETTLIKYAVTAEDKSEHPLSNAIKEYANEKSVRPESTSQFNSVVGQGLVAEYNGKNIYAGNTKFINSKTNVSKEWMDKAEMLASEGKTPLLFAYDEEFLGIIAVADTIKDDSAQAVMELKNMGIHVVMLTGDNEKTANAIGKQSMVDEVIAGVLPDGKESVIRKLQKQGKVIMVGDGINDAPALTRADIGIAIGAGTDIAIDAADVVITKSRLTDVCAAIRLSRATLKNIHQNLFWAFFYNVIGIPLAAGVWIPLLNWELNPMFGAAAMSLSSFCVVTNALRLNLVKIYNNKKDKKIKENKKVEEKEMTKTMKIEGMMCGHCEARVKKTLEAMEQVSEAVVSHVDGTAVVTLNSEVEDDVLKKAIEDQDYKVISIN